LLRRRALMALAIALCALIGAHLVLGAKSPARDLVGRFAQTFDSEHHSTRQRLAIWALDLQMVAGSPLLGHGWGSHELLFQPQLLENLRDDPEGHWEGIATLFDGNIAYHAHCDYLELMVAAGFPGLLLFAWVLMSALVRGGRSLRVAPPDLRWVIGGGIAAVICLAVIAVVSFPLHRIAQSMVLWIALGVCSRAPRLAQTPR
ncbi:O-antigen ligase family protein, partial [Candidatus Sumerlaeota bacterium]|nr:O-antigen ligase family protein [Candidatus Sumerlaeota bacterium]